MELNERVQIFERLFDDLQSTNSRLNKELLINEFKQDYPQLETDLTVILETLDNRHPIGWTFVQPNNYEDTADFDSIAEMIFFCENIKEKSNEMTGMLERMIGKYSEFLAPIVNRTLRLGIGKSLLVKDNITPMLAKKYESGSILFSPYAVTEKLDGNRCVAYYDTDMQIWQFRSRSGKPLKVDFDMTGLPEEFIYDGEIMSIDQTQRSVKRHELIKEWKVEIDGFGSEQALFNKTSGIINSKAQDKKLVYNIFDIITDRAYFKRRELLLEATKEHTEQIRVLPQLYIGTDTDHIDILLSLFIKMGGEGLMLNDVNRIYENKRSNALLKYKKVQFCDMIVTDVFEGKGKYEYACGGLKCYMLTQDGREVICDVGSGLSDFQRQVWWRNPDLIIGKIVEIGYHELSQDAHTYGSNKYSLRFPRLLRVRTDKDTTSEF